jgi:far upstream element-binding protein
MWHYSGITHVLRHFIVCFQKARELVLQLMEQKELEARGLLGSETSMAGSVVGVPHTIEIQVLKQMVGYVIGRGGEHINNIQSNCGVRLQFQNGNYCVP